MTTPRRDADTCVAADVLAAAGRAPTTPVPVDPVRGPYAVPGGPVRYPRAAPASYGTPGHAPGPRTGGLLPDLPRQKRERRSRGVPAQAN
ncbi:hypothetical protein LUX12_21825 [Streptomyces somaliensis]|uniref:hypothetical protein n=1 Tax=Streptomyces somaliensis TaxID=78355 RepID=UPI0020CB6C92|nr:hypothetical protein [Streptomyces somaliensis]MCP9946844.1 hypothetical protein [Streptomyces somaliensis]MCP9963482.1 hypothetical protein [Streptomyces somaliensis]MCP9976243.1 hypothetical protein [Streptomyces somaliensis]